MDGLRIWMMAVIVAYLIAGGVCKALESPEYAVIYSESNFEIRHYVDSAWMKTDPIKDISFEKATRDGFRRLFEYIQGGNLNSSKVSMTKPVLTSIVPGAGPLHSSAYYVCFYLPLKFHTSPPVPLPELNLKPDTWTSRCIAIRKFSGFARDSNIVEEAEKLAISLERSTWANSTSSESKYSYSIAQYNSPFRFIGRVNEVWVEVNGCVSDPIATT